MGENDAYLLELAAKSIGVDGEYSENIGEDWGRHEGLQGIAVNGTCWNPLLNDGDALRLAVKLHLLSNIDMLQKFLEASNEREPLEATRRAIVLAAAKT